VTVPSLPVAIAAADDWAWEVQVVPNSSGTARLDVLVIADGATGAQARSIVVPIGSAAPSSSAPVRVAENGERIVALPAQESPAYSAR
jgi:hypothetical protein